MAERGSLGALRFMRWFYRTCGRRATVALLYPVAGYFFLTDRALRAASLGYLEQLWALPEGRAALGSPPGARHVFRHILEFAINILDRMVIWGGEHDQIEIEHQGSENLLRLWRERRGGILLGAHLGSFDMLRLISAQAGVVVNVVMFTRHAVQINAFFERLSPDSKVRVIQLDPGSVRTIFEIKACIERGEFVGILGDRVWQGERTAVASFLGRPARFPLGPFLLPGLLDCPMLLSLCLRTGPSSYQALALPFAEGGVVPRAERGKRAEELVQSYARMLEQRCLQAPYQWFNFFDFWAGAETPSPAARRG
jgi:predicted LPLAT superfamily acyltransferase